MRPAAPQVLLTQIFSQYPVHDNAYAYVKGKSIRANALRHASSHFILKLDFNNFFNSIRPRDLERSLINNRIDNLTPQDFEDIYSLSFWGAGTRIPFCLSVGAPTSPIISNIVMHDFDKMATDAADSLGIIYTRYADDITASSAAGPNPLLIFERKLASIIRESSLDLTFNEKKRGLYGRGQRRMVTGLIITPDGSISIGRDRKREIRASLHRLAKGEGDDILLMRSKGLLAFVMSAERSFLKSLYRTYGRDFVRSVIRSPQKTFYIDETTIELD